MIQASSSVHGAILPTPVHNVPVFMGLIKGEVKAKIKISPVVVFGVLSRMVLVRES